MSIMKEATRSLAVLAALGAAAALAACSAHEVDSAVKPTPVHVEVAGSGPARAAIQTDGVVATKDEMRLSFKVAGVIRKIYVRQGETVTAGTRLADIELTEIDAQVEQTRELAAKAERDLARGQRLYGDQVISLEQLQDLKTQAALQAAQLKSAQFNRGFAVIVAPRSGVILRKLADERELVQAGQPVLSLGAQDRGYVVRAAIADRDVVELALGDAARIHLDAYPGRSFGGTITEIASAADDKTGLFPIEVQFEGTPVPLATGLVAKLSLTPASAQAATLTYVPIAAVVEGDRDRASVFVAAADHVRRRPVQIAFIGANEVALASGVRPGEPVVTDGALYLTDGERVEIIAQTARAGVRPASAATAN